MNRPIEFRAWDKEIKTMIGSELIGLMIDGKTIVSMPKLTIPLTMSEVVSKKIPFRRISGSPFMNNTLVVMQYTGLKDKNGVKIFEGDIVKVNSTYEPNEDNEAIESIAKVSFREGAFVTSFYNTALRGMTKKGNWEYEVIGNEFDHGGLLCQKG